jgi:monoamine oxidase
MARLTSFPAIHNAITLLLASSSLVLAAAISDPVDVVVVGAGLAGLTSARDLLAGGKTVMVLEARDRVGGKVHNAKLKNGGVTEVGAEFVGPTQDKVLQMISDLGLKTFKTYNEGNSILWRNNTRLVYVPDPRLHGAPPVAIEALDQIQGAQQLLNNWTAEIDVNAPWNDAKAAEWDKMTFDDFISTNAPHPDARLVLTSACKGIFAAEPREISLLYAIAYVASGGNETTKGTLESTIAVQNGAQESRVEGGTGLIPERLAEKVGAKHITLNAVVSSIKKTPTGYCIESRAGSFQAKQVVVAMPPPLQKRIKFSPALPKAHQNLINGLKLPAIGKGIAVYNAPFWRTSNETLDGQVVSDQGSVKVTFDSSDSNGKFGAILGFILGDEMRALDKISAKEAENLITSDYVRYYGSQAANTTEFVLQRWDLEEFSKGGPVAIAPPGVFLENGHALRESFGGIHFAGTETSVYWTGYMDGAIRSGERVAREILGH